MSFVFICKKGACRETDMENGACVVFDVSQGEFDPGELLALWDRSVRATARGVRIRFCIWH